MNVPNDPTTDQEPQPPTSSADDQTTTYAAPADSPLPSGASPQPDLCPTLGPYELLEPLHPDRGGTVYRARHRLLERKVLIRMLESPHAENEAERTAFAQRCQALCRLGHPNLATGVFEARLEGSTPYVVFDRVSGKPLPDLGPRRFSERRLEPLYPNDRLGCALLDAARGLAALHRAGLVHGNLGPSALRVALDDTIQLTDLGHEEGAVAEAAHFAPPPGWADGTPSQRDLFALGCTFYYLTTATLPATSEPGDVKVLNPGVARRLADILDRCLAAEPERRYVSADDLVADAQIALSTEVVLVPSSWRILAAGGEATGACVAGGLVVAALAWMLGYRPGDMPTFPEVMALGTPALLYFLIGDTLFGGTWAKRRLGFVIADRAGDPASARQRLLRALLKGAGLATLGGAEAAAITYVIDRIMFQKPTAGSYLVGLVPFAFVPVAGLVVGVLVPMVLQMEETLSPAYRRWRRFLRPEDRGRLRSMIPMPDQLADTRLTLPRAAVCPDEGMQPEPAVPGPEIGVEWQVEQYNVGPRLGAGGMGTVHRAWDRALGRAVALKFLGPQVQDRPGIRERFEREARLAAQLNHPNVGQVHGAGGWPEDPYLALEMIEGETLQQRVERLGPLPLAEVWGYGLQVTAALRAADRLGIIHRDIKPQNLMVAPDGTVKVMDFGIARRTAEEMSLTETGAVVGTPLYMSPEQATARDVDRRSDLYSLGVTLHFLLTGHTPFRAANRMDLLALQMTDSPPSLLGKVQGLTEEQDRILRRLLARDREERYADHDALAAALREEAPEAHTPAPRALRIADGTVYLLFCLMVTLGPLMLLNFAYALFVGGQIFDTPFWGLMGNPHYLLGAQIAITLATPFVLAQRPSMHPFAIPAAPGWRRVLLETANALGAQLLAILGFWPGLHRALGLRVVTLDNRRVTMGWLTLRFAVTYPYLLPWLLLQYLPGMTVEWFNVPLLVVNGVLGVVSVLLILFHPQRRHLGDWITGTKVIQVLPPQGTATADAEELSAAQPASPPRRWRLTPGLVVGVLLPVLFLVALIRGLSGLVDRVESDRRRFDEVQRHREEVLRVREHQFAVLGRPEGVQTVQRLARLGQLFTIWDEATERSAREINPPPSSLQVEQLKKQGARNCFEATDRDCLTAPRFQKPFVLIWEQVPEWKWRLEAGRLLAFEPAADEEGCRFVLLAGEMGVGILSEDKFQEKLAAAAR